MSGLAQVTAATAYENRQNAKLTYSASARVALSAGLPDPADTRLTSVPQLPGALIQAPWPCPWPPGVRPVKTLDSRMPMNLAIMVATQVFVPFAVTRLQQRPEDTEAVLTVALRGIEEQATEDCPLRLFWGRDSIAMLPPAVGEQPLTEWAALGVACAVIWHFAGLRLHAVAALGDRVDYWVKREDREFGLEISGTRTTDLEVRHQEKIQQLLANPYGADGYVVVVGFATRSVIFSFHRINRGSP